MNLLTKLEKSKTCWFLLGIIVLFFFLRLPSLIEPNWYGDEGIYQVLGQAMHSGRMLYSEAWDNKPPFLYITYALFDGDQFWVRSASLIVGLLSLIIFFFLSKRLLKNAPVAVLTSLLFTLLFATPLIEGNIANAENFILLPVIAAGFLIYRLVDKQKQFTVLTPRWALLIAGVLLGVAFLFKIVAIFDFATMLFFLVLVGLPKHFSKGIHTQLVWIRPLLHQFLFLTAGFLLPVIVTCLYFFATNTFDSFIQAVLFGNIGYVGYGNKLIIPQGFLILKILLLLISMIILFLKRNSLSRPALFILVWFGFSVFNAFFSQRPYTHYLLVMVPSWCLLVGLILITKQVREKLLLIVLFLISTATLVAGFHLSGYMKKVLYYQNAILFVTEKKDITSYQAFFDGKTPRDYEVASFIKLHTNKNDVVFVWGDNAQIYSLSGTLPPNKYTVAYHIRGSNQAIRETQQSLNTLRPKYVIILAEAPSFPFSLDSYLKTFSLERATIYERTF